MVPFLMCDLNISRLVLLQQDRQMARTVSLLTVVLRNQMLLFGATFTVSWSMTIANAFTMKASATSSLRLR